MGGGHRLCPRCGRSLDDHVDGLQCPRSLNGDRKAQQVRDKHVIDGDYTPKPRSGAYPRTPTKPLSVSMTRKEVSSFRHHGQLPTLALLVDMALEQLLKNMAQNQPAIIVQHPNIEENDDDAHDQDEVDHHPNIAVNAQENDDAHDQDEVDHLNIAVNAEENDHAHHQDEVDHPNIAANAQEENDAQDQDTDAAPTHQESTPSPTPTPTPSPSPSP